MTIETSLVARMEHDMRGPRASLTLLGSATNETNSELVRELRLRGLETTLVPAREALRLLRPGDRALARLDVLPTLDGVEPGLLALLLLERRGVRILNSAHALLAAHDKLRTVCLRRAASLPHPTSAHMRFPDERPPIEPPLVLKPRFGSWGLDVTRCDDRADLDRTLAAVRKRPWFRRHGALVQQQLPTHGSDLRVIVACGEIIGAAERVAAPGAWRTNISLGGSLRAMEPPPEARALALAAAHAIGADVVEVDLFPVDGGYVVLELNGAVDFDARYSISAGDAYAALVRSLLATEMQTLSAFEKVDAQDRRCTPRRGGV